MSQRSGPRASRMRLARNDAAAYGGRDARDPKHGALMIAGTKSVKRTRRANSEKSIPFNTLGQALRGFAQGDPPQLLLIDPLLRDPHSIKDLGASATVSPASGWHAQNEQSQRTETGFVVPGVPARVRCCVDRRRRSDHVWRGAHSGVCTRLVALGAAAARAATRTTSGAARARLPPCSRYAAPARCPARTRSVGRGAQSGLSAA